MAFARSSDGQVILEERRSGSADYPDLGECVELLHRYSKLPNLSKIGQSSHPRSMPIAHPRTHRIRKRLSTQTITQLVADYEAGASSTALMKKYQLGKGTVLKILRQAGVIRQQRKLTTEHGTAGRGSRALCPGLVAGKNWRAYGLRPKCYLAQT